MSCLRFWTSVSCLFFLMMFPMGCKRKNAEAETEVPPAASKTDDARKTADIGSCSWRNQTVKDSEWADDGENNSVNRYCKCEAGKFVQCSKELPANISADKVVLIKGSASGDTCIWNGKEIGNGRWVEDSTAKFRYCQCRNGKFVETSCSNTPPANQEVVIISNEANASCSFKSVTVAHGKWAEDLSGTAASRFCKCENGSFPAATCVAALPAGVNAADVVKVGQPAAGLACTFKGVTVPHEKWAEDTAGNAAFKFCQCLNGQFPPANCGPSLPGGVNQTDVIKIP